MWWIPGDVIVHYLCIIISIRGACVLNLPSIHSTITFRRYFDIQQRKGAAIGDVFLTTAVANHDRRIAIPSFTPYGIGRIESTSVEKLAAHLDAKLGVCTTGNSLDFHELDSHHMLENDASVKDMEAAAIAWASEIWSTPHFGVKVVTDIVDGTKPSHEEFMENLGTAAEKLQSTLPKVIDYVCDKKHDEL